MNVSREDKKVEAVARMKLLGIYPETIDQFERKDLVSISEPPFGAFFWVDEEDKKRIQQFEQEYNAPVFVVIRSYTNIGKMDSYLFVSDYREEEWEMDRDDLRHGQTCAYVYNHDAPDCSEIGAIGIVGTPAAGLCRVW